MGYMSNNYIYIQKSYENVVGPLFVTVACVLVVDHEKWKSCRLKILENLILMSHVREFSLNPKSSFTESEKQLLQFSKVGITIVYFTYRWMGYANFLRV